MSGCTLKGCVIVGLSLLLGAGCASAPSSADAPLVIFLDGAGWAGSQRGVRSGLEAAGFEGHVEVFPWTSLLGPVPDHLLAGRNQKKGKELARRIARRRRAFPQHDLHVMGLSAGTAVIVFALEQLPPGVTVDNVVLFASSISADHDLSLAMEHVNGHLYATSSPHDEILGGLRINADGQTGRPAGLDGLRIPSRVKRYDHYTRVVNLAWRPAYIEMGWSGSHTGVTDHQFVRDVIAPRVLSTGAEPLNRPVAPPWIAQWARQ